VLVLVFVKCGQEILFICCYFISIELQGPACVVVGALQGEKSSSHC
jgi:hypothetical protein